MKARTLILTAAVAASVAPAALASTGTQRTHQTPTKHTRVTRIERSTAYVSLTDAGLYQVAVHTLLAG